MPRWDREPWVNWAGDIVIERPERHYYPGSLSDLVEIVHDAEKQVPARKVRATGSHWALSDVPVSPDWFVETAALSRTLETVVPTALTDLARDGLFDQPAVPGSRFAYVYVEGGVTISDLNVRLDSQPLPYDGVGNATSGGAATRWALPTMGGAGGMTIAGAISTSTHGGDHQLPPLGDAVQAIHMVTVGGRQLWIEREHPLTDPDRLEAELPGVTPHYSNDLFDAALVSVGRMGIIYAVVLRVVEQFSLEQSITATTWTDMRPQCEAPFTVFDRTPDSAAGADGRRSTFVEVVLPPHPRKDGHHSCSVTHRWRGPDRGGRTPPSSDAFSVICRMRSIRPVLLAALGAVLLVLVLFVAIPVIGTVVAGAAALLAVAILVALVTAGSMTVGEVVASACNLLNRWGQGWLIQRFNDWVISRFRPGGRERVEDVGYAVMDLGRAGWNCYRADSLEVAFDASVGEHIRFIDEDLLPAFARDAKAGTALGGYVSLRFTKASSALLAMQRWDPTCHIEVALLQGVTGTVPLLERLQAAALARGGTVHWGQYNTLTNAQTARSHPGLERWRHQLAEITGTPALDTFDNDFCRQRGLEPD